MSDLLNPVVLSVLVLALLSLARVNVVIALLLSALTAGLAGGLSVEETASTLVEGLGGQGETALSYILLGTLAVMVSRSGLTEKLIRRVLPLLRGPKAVVLFAIAGLASLSQNVVPVHIAFIPILIPPLLGVFDRLRIDRRAIASALTFGLKAPYLLVPLGFGLIFQGIIADEMAAHGMAIDLARIPLAMAIPVGGMVVGLAVAILISYRRPRLYTSVAAEAAVGAGIGAAPGAGNSRGGGTGDDGDDAGRAAGAAGAAPSRWRRGDVVVLVGLATTLVLQLVYGSLVIAALAGILVIFLLRGESWRDGDPIIDRGVAMMGTIAFIMLIASGYAQVLTETGAVESLVAAAGDWIGGSRLLAAVLMMLVGMLVTMGIGTSFGTVPVLAAIFVPLAASLGFSPLATAALIGAAGGIGDAGSPASDSTLGPTSGLNADGRHHHIWDTCVPTFLHYNIPLFIGGVVAAMVL